jgi:hypothetical protein
VKARPGDEARAAVVRLRSTAPVLAFALPALLLVVAGLVSASKGDDAALPWVAAAAPVTGVLAVLRAGGGAAPLGLPALLVSAVASAPLWALLGMSLARRVESFAAFWRWYALFGGAWTVVALVLIG